MQYTIKSEIYSNVKGSTLELHTIPQHYAKRFKRKTNHRSVIDKTASSLRAAYALIRMWYIRSPVTHVTSST